MIARLKGTVLDRDDRSVVIDVGGVGYRVSVVVSLRDRLAAGSLATLHIHHHVSSDQETLFGFLSDEELRYFKLLLTVPSVGPRTALNILEVAPPKVLAQAVATGDRKLLTKVSGVGPRTADRILVELKEKFKDVIPEGPRGDVQQEAIAALVSIGFTTTQAREAIQKLPQHVESVEQAVREALKHK